MKTAILLLVVSPCIFAATFSNVAPRRDVTGKIMDAHDGSYRQFPASGTKLWYYYAMGYGLCTENNRSATHNGCGTTQNNTINLWTSPNLVDWTFVADVLPMATRPTCIYYRSHAVYNSNTKKYVLSANAQGCVEFCGVHNGCYITATSDKPEGPFAIQGKMETKYTLEGGVGDQSIFIDDDADSTAYLIHKRAGGAQPKSAAHRILIEKLTADYLHSTNETLGIFGDPFVEAPAMIKRKGTYYAFFGKCCAFCSSGSGIGVYTADHPLGPYTKQTNIGCTSQPQPGCGCGGAPYTKDPNRNCTAIPAVTQAQQNFVIEIPASDSDADSTFMWTGDQWQSACRVPGLNCVKGWDVQYWSPLKWNESHVPPVPTQLHWQDTVEF
jgi:hypothetical protein